MRPVPPTVLLAMTLTASAAAAADPAVVDRPPTVGRNTHYVGNREPLRPTPFVQLPISSFKPAGWLGEQLKLMKDGYTGQLPRISRFLQKERNSWLDPEGDQSVGWEEVPYWLRGYIDLAYLLGDAAMQAEAKAWVEAAIKSQAADGYFGPKRNRAAPPGFDRTVGKPDLWANMVMTDCLISYFDKTGDQRVLDLLAKYFKWVAAIPEGDFLTPYWQKVRGADLLAQILWLYNRTDDKALLDLARRTYRNTTDWSLGLPDDHNVNVAEAFRGPATYWLVSGDDRHKRITYRGYEAMMDAYGQMPGGGVASDERWRKGYDGPRNMFETCGMVEMMHSHELLTQFTGDPVWADRCEDVAFNSLPAAVTADYKGLRYLTAPNMVLSDRLDRRPEVYNGGPMTLFNPYGHRCCQHNSGFGWPYFAKNTWYATADNGLAAVLYAPITVTATVADGAEVTVEVKTQYPFREAVELVVKPSKPAKFPLYLRVPGWADEATVAVGSNTAKVAAAGRYVKLDREWAGETRVTLTFAMPVRVHTWAAQKNAVTVYRGPLAYSVKIPEKVVRVDSELPKTAGYTAAGEKRLDEFPITEIHPGGPWNYGLVLDPKDPAAGIAVESKPWPADDQPFRWDAAPVELTVSAKKIPNWKLDYKQMPGRLQPSPVKSDEPTEKIRMIPMGCARLRMTVLPVIGTGPGAHEWAEPPPPRKPEVTASHCNDGDSEEAVIDGLRPKNSADRSIPRFTWWDHRGTEEWIQREFKAPREVSAVLVYWFEDTGHGFCRVPESWKLYYRTGGRWRPVKAKVRYGVAKDVFNVVEFDPVKTDALRIEVKLRDGFSGGILEWEVR